MSNIFDGRTYASKKKELLRAGVTLFKEKGIIPHMATILIGEDMASKLYVNLKKKFIEDIGCHLDVYVLNEDVSFDNLKLLIESLNIDDTVHGIMIQFPLPEKLSSLKDEILDLIDPIKDVDGLKKDSKYLHPTAKAVIEIISLASFETKQEIKTICVIGSTGMVGEPLTIELKRIGYNVLACNKDTDNLNEKTLSAECVVSATGVANIITTEMVKDNVVAIDVGSPFGDISPMISEKASFITPVPGGVGPVTITCLAENLLLAVGDIIKPN